MSRGPNVLGPKWVRAQMSRGPNELGPKCVGAQMSRGPNVLGPKWVGAQMCWGPNESGAQMSGDQMSQGPKWGMGPNVSQPFWTYQKKSFRALIPRPPMLFFTKSAQNWPSKENCYCSVAQQSRVRQQCGFGFNVFKLQEKKVIRYLTFFCISSNFLMGKHKILLLYAQQVTLDTIQI